MFQQQNAYSQPNAYTQPNAYSQPNAYQYNEDTYLRYNMYPFAPYYGNQMDYYQPFEVSFMNQQPQAH
ncbi:spore coat protein, partial [Bacillus pseudomycoides]